MEDLPVNTYNNRWALNSDYMTPAHMANFRPAYVEKLKKDARSLEHPKRDPVVLNLVEKALRGFSLIDAIL